MAYRICVSCEDAYEDAGGESEDIDGRADFMRDFGADVSDHTCDDAEIMDHSASCDCNDCEFGRCECACNRQVS